MKVVVNAGPLINLGKLGLVSLFHRLYETMLVPSAVYKEVVTAGMASGQPDAYAVQMAVVRRELTVIEARDEDLPQVMQVLPLGSGEKHTIYLGLKEPADLVLLDDSLARQEAKRLGLSVKGTLGVIGEAHRQDILTLEECEVAFQAILSRSDIWISEALVHHVWEALKKQQGQ